MAFKYSDGLIYESDFHYWYVNGRKPKMEGKIEVFEREIRPAGEGSPIIHPAHEISGRQRIRGKGRGPEWC